MYDERINFLPIESGGKTALIIGMLSVELATIISNSFETLVVMDWDGERLEQLDRTMHHSLKIVPIEIGKPNFTAGYYDLIIVFWSEAYLGQPGSWIDQLTQRLNPQGRLAIVERINRHLLNSQALTSEILDLEIELHTISHQQIKFQTDYDTSKYFRNDKFKQIRNQSFTDPDLIFSTDAWYIEANRILNAVANSTKTVDKLQADEWNKQIMLLRSKLERISPETPPFMMTKGVKRATTASVVREKDQNIGLKPHYQKSEAQNHQVNPINEQNRDPNNLSDDELLKWVVSILAEDTNDSKLKCDDKFVADLTESICQGYGLNTIGSVNNPINMMKLLKISQELANRLVALFEIGRRVFRKPLEQMIMIRNAGDVYDYLTDMHNFNKESFRGLYLNVHGRLIHDEVISVGTLVQSPVHPREVFAPALIHSAHSVMVAHNHPSGDPTPSNSDILITQKLMEAGSAFGIELKDHVVISINGFTSIRKTMNSDDHNSPN